MNVGHHSLTFSQRNGYEPVPAPLALEEISDKARRKLWDLLCVNVGRSVGEELLIFSPWGDILLTLHSDFRDMPIDTYSPYFHLFQEEYEWIFLSGATFNSIFDLLEMVMRHPKCPKSFIEGVAEIFEECQMAYVVDTNQPPTIIPAATKEEGEAIVNAMIKLRDVGLDGAETHLRNAGACINKCDWAGSVRESINAVESVARRLDKNKSNTLAAALKSLDSKHSIHHALKDGFIKLYGYTSSEQGVRHALLDSEKSAVGQDEAVFMLGACASFVSYLLHKEQAIK